jgi:dTDP-glucose 4,6-dehydratase
MAELVAKYWGKKLKFVFEDFHTTRPGHDLRYALDGTKLAELGWTPPMSLERSLELTVEWTKKNPQWLWRT